MKCRVVYAGENLLDEDYPYKTFKVLNNNQYVTTIFEYNKSFLNLFTNRCFDSVEQATDSAISYLNR